MDAELEFAIQPNTTGKQLFDQVWEMNNLDSQYPVSFQWLQVEAYVFCLLNVLKYMKVQNGS